MSRNLLTADEIKQLHYKTIIFPSIGYPIFRNTVLYKKFKCYKSGYLDRKVKTLKRLINTYYTVEQLTEDNNTNIEVNEKLKLIVQEILKSFTNIDYDIEYVDTKVANIYLSTPMSKSDLVMLNNLSETMKFRFNIFIGKENINRDNRNSKIEINLS